MNTQINNTLKSISIKSGLNYDSYINDSVFINSVFDIIIKESSNYSVYYCSYFGVTEMFGLNKNQAINLATVLLCNFDIEFYNNLNK